MKWVRLRPGERALDCATGTGDLAIKLKLSCPEAQVVGADFCEDMLNKAPQKARNAKVQVQFLVADTLDLPFPDASFDVATISFGIRNVVDPVRGLREMSRVLKPKGRLYVLEFGQPSFPLFSQFYRFYSETLLPRIGGLVTGQPDAYRYLQSSSASFPCGEKFATMLTSATPFERIDVRPLMGGVVYMYRAILPA